MRITFWLFLSNNDNLLGLLFGSGKSIGAQIRVIIHSNTCSGKFAKIRQCRSGWKFVEVASYDHCDVFI